MTDLVSIVEKRAHDAWKTVEGPNYDAIIRDVATENNVTEDELRAQCRKRWASEAGMG